MMIFRKYIKREKSPYLTGHIIEKYKYFDAADPFIDLRMKKREIARR